MRKRRLIATVLTALLMTSGTTGASAATAPLAGRIQPGVTYSGPGTWYDSDGDGACLFGRSADMMTVAMNQTDYETSKACGAYLEVRASNGRTIQVRVNNLCPSPCRVGQLDLTREAFSRLADPVVGEISVTWRLLSPAMSTGISLRYKDGSSQWWCGIQAIDHRNPVARLEVRTAGGWKQLRRTDYNYFLSEDGAGCGGAIAITDIYGQRLVSDPLPIRPGVAQPTNLQFAPR
ncbi:expansin EXLX1 family cellulose-binding protein [Saccharothrix variisporea]|uniref:Expansin (Peptidoglycan-binding protein) n=1 Tax=Saccharothrix variisporea TaxID=543527 RepID=A0A495XJB5_9PSEU|nr:expansin EXLX1 family cellulose-binding protein [Saccharothrix variisporea]RKT74611.1 expansin (peptidoglycan-binding protein) [Saccharothrix variisporea]